LVKELNLNYFGRKNREKRTVSKLLSHKTQKRAQNKNNHTEKDTVKVDSMADPTTELAKEFLESNRYLVRKETKFYKNKELAGTASDIDIIATSPKGIKIDDLELKKNIIGEVKNWGVRKKKRLDKIYENKFKYVNDLEISWKQLKKYISSKVFDKVLFCLATTEDVYNYAMRKYDIKIVTTGFIIKQIARFFKTSPRNWTYYPEWYNYNIIRSVMYYLFSSHKHKDKLTLQDVVWIDPEKESRYRNQFAKLNSKFLEDFVYYQTSGEIFSNLIDRFAKEYPEWFKGQLKSDRKFWVYLTK